MLDDPPVQLDSLLLGHLDNPQYVMDWYSSGSQSTSHQIKKSDLKDN